MAFRAVLIIVLASAVLVGCGGDDDGQQVESVEISCSNLLGQDDCSQLRVNIPCATCLVPLSTTIDIQRTQIDVDDLVIDFRQANYFDLMDDLSNPNLNVRITPRAQAQIDVVRAAGLFDEAAAAARALPRRCTVVKFVPVCW
jgi:hypothetical protein